MQGSPIEEFSEGSLTVGRSPFRDDPLRSGLRIRQVYGGRSFASSVPPQRAVGLPPVVAAGYGDLPYSLWPGSWGDLLFPGIVMGGGGGGGGTVTITQSTGIAVSPSGIPSSSFTIAHALSAGTLMGISGATINCLITAGANLSFAGNTLNAADQAPTDGYATQVVGTDVNWIARAMPCLFLVNATYNGSSFTTGVAPTALTLNRYVYKGVPVKLTALSHSGGSLTLGYAIDDDAAFEPSAYGGASYVEIWNMPELANSSTFAMPGTNIGATNYPPDFQPRGLGEKRDEGGGASTWITFLRAGLRWRMPDDSYRWLIGLSGTDDGECPE